MKKTVLISAVFAALTQASGAMESMESSASQDPNKIISEKIIFGGTVEEFTDLCDRLGQEDSNITNLKICSDTNEKLGQDDFYYLGSQLCKNKTLLSLDLSGLPVDDWTAEHLGTKMCWPLRSNKSFALQILNLSNLPLCNRIGDSFKSALEASKSLKELYLDGCSLGNDVMTSIGEALCTNSTLEVLSLSHNNISNKGACNFADSLTQNETLISLNISFNNIEVDGFNLLMYGVANNKTLQSLNLEFNKIWFEENDFSYEDDADLKLNGEFFHLNELSLKEFKIGGNKLSDNPIYHDQALFNIGASLRKSTSLTSLSLSHSGLNDDNIGKLFEALLSEGSTLCHLCLSDNQIGDVGAMKISSFFDSMGR